MKPIILEQVAEAGHVVFTRGKWNLNLIGVRKANRKANQFDDEFHLIFKDDRNQWNDVSLACTTDPGLYWLHNPMRSAGTAILKAGQYRGAYEIGLHRGRYPALVQRKPVKVFRDRNRNDVLDMDPNTEIEGLFGINIHHAGFGDSHRVEKWSAGCTVIQSITSWEILMSIVRKSADLWGDRFTYTLLEEKNA